jgi:hypothetical protein
VHEPKNRQHGPVGLVGGSWEGPRHHKQVLSILAGGRVELACGEGGVAQGRGGCCLHTRSRLSLELIEQQRWQLAAPARQQHMCHPQLLGQPQGHVARHHTAAPRYAKGAACPSGEREEGLQERGRRGDQGAPCMQLSLVCSETRGKGAEGGIAHGHATDAGREAPLNMLASCGRRALLWLLIHLLEGRVHCGSQVEGISLEDHAPRGRPDARQHLLPSGLSGAGRSEGAREGPSGGELEGGGRRRGGCLPTLHHGQGGTQGGDAAAGGCAAGEAGGSVGGSGAAGAGTAAAASAGSAASTSCSSSCHCSCHCCPGAAGATAARPPGGGGSWRGRGGARDDRDHLHGAGTRRWASVARGEVCRHPSNVVRQWGRWGRLRARRQVLWDLRPLARG